MFRYDEFRRPIYWEVDVNIAKTTPITDKMRFQVRLEAFNIFNSPMYDERELRPATRRRRTSAASTATPRAQSNFQRFIQLGFRLIF